MTVISLIIVLMLILSAFFSGIEIAFISANRLKQELDIKRNIFSAKILNVFFYNPSRFIGALLLGNNIALVVYGTAMAVLLEPLIAANLPAGFNSESIQLLSQTILSTLIILVTAEFLPKVLFRINPNSTLKFFAVPVWLFYYVFYPINMIYIGVSELLLKKIFRIKLSSSAYEFSPIDLEEFVKDYKPGENKLGEINQEIQMIQNAMGFKFVKLRECMVPRIEIKAIDINENIDELFHLFAETGYSKIMVFVGSIDNLVGYVHASDLFLKPENIESVVRKVDVYPETMTANTLLNQLIVNRKSMAIVVDEFGGTSGIITMEDIIEEIFGEIQDEHDTEDEKEIQLSENEFIFSTRLEIDYLNEKYKLNLPESDEYGTLAGFILHHYESIPQVNDVIEIPPFVFTILKSGGNRIVEVKLQIDK